MSSKTKLSRDEVPHRFSEWLLAMGCPEDKIPGTDKISQMCRGEYYMVWRGMMERVQPRDVVTQKRLQVFCRDLQKCTDAKNQKDSVIIPEELKVWREHNELTRKRRELEAMIDSTRKQLTQTTDKLNSKLAHRATARTRSEDAGRRAWLLQCAAEDLRIKRQNLNETRNIAESLCHVNRNGDSTPVDIDKCVSLLSRNSPQGGAFFGSLSMIAGSNPVACSSIIQTANDSYDHAEEQLISILKQPAHLVWKQLLQRRSQVLQELTSAHTEGVVVAANDAKRTTQSVLAHTAALHAHLSLSAMKCRLQLKQTRQQLQREIQDLSVSFTGPECELIVLRCERASSEARVATLKLLWNQIADRDGPFAVIDDSSEGQHYTASSIAHINRDIVNKKEEIKGVLSSLTKIEKKTQKVRESLNQIFSGYHRDIDLNVTRDESIKQDCLSVPNSTTAVRQFYKRRRDNKPKLDLSMEFDTSDHSYIDYLGHDLEPRYVDELKLYLKRFNLESNRKLILDNGEKIWIFETLQASTSRLYERWLSADITCSLVSPSVGPAVSLTRLFDDVTAKAGMELFVNSLLSSTPKVAVDLDSRINREEEARQLDIIKKRLNDNLTSLNKITKTIDQAEQNIDLWSSNLWRKYISDHRQVDGKCYRELESHYLNLLNPL